MERFKQKAIVAAIGLAPLAAMAQASNPWDTAVTTLTTAAAAVVVSAWGIWAAVRVPGLVMKIVNKFTNKAS